MAPKITHKSIAEAAGVSQATVSKALADSREISAATSERVRLAAEKLGYFQKQRERRRRTAEVLFPHVAILVPEIVSWTYASEVSALQASIEAIGGAVEIHVTGFDEARFNIAIDRLNREGSADCILSFEGYTFAGHSRLPLGYMGCHAVPKDRRNFAICARTEDAISAAVRYLWELGHRKIGFIGERNTLYKKEFFLSAMAKCGAEADEELIITSTSRFERIGHEGIRALHIRGTMPTALITAYDEVAFGAIQELRNLGYRVPEDISVIGYNDVPHAVYHDPPLTTIRVDTEARDREAVRLILESISGRYTGEREIVLPAELIVRESCARARA